MAELDQIEEWVAPLLKKLEPTQRKQLARTIGTELRKSQRQRIAQQKNPDGSKYAPGQKRRAPLNKPKRFYYERTGRVAELKSYADFGDRYTGYDLEAGGIRTFSEGAYRAILHPGKKRRWQPSAEEGPHQTEDVHQDTFSQVS